MDKMYGFCCFLLFILINLSSGKDPKGCPPKNLIDPCFCEKLCTNCPVSISCWDVQHHEVLTRVINQSREYQYESLNIKNATFMYIPASIFEMRKLTTLYVWTSKLVSLFDSPPKVNYDMEVIMLNEVKVMRQVQWQLLADIQKLRRLKLMHTPLKRINRRFRESVPKQLEELTIYNCSTETMDDEAFSSLTNLLDFSLQHGNLKKVKRSMFPNPTALRSITLGFNKIEALPENIFSDMPSLTIIQLQNNRISEINENIFKPIFPRLTEFKIFDNPIDCHCSIRWIVTVDRKKLRRFMGECTEPSELAGRALGDLKTSDFEHCG